MGRLAAHPPLASLPPLTRLKGLLGTRTGGKRVCRSTDRGSWVLQGPTPLKLDPVPRIVQCLFNLKHRLTLRNVYTVKHVSALTGIPSATLRMWERRYAVVEPVRSSSGYRLYDDDAIQRLIAMRALVAAGWAARLAAEQVLSGTTIGPFANSRAEAAPPLEAKPDSIFWAGDRVVEADDGLAQAAIDIDPRALDTTLDFAFSQGNFEEVVDDWLMPALMRVGEAWNEGRVTVAGEHLVSAAVQRRFSAVLDATPSPSSPPAPTALVGLARGSRHELGVLAFATAIKRAGVMVNYVGADLPVDSWVVTVTRTAPDAVVLAVPFIGDVPAARDTVSALHAVRPDLPIFVGGRHQDDEVGSAITLGHRIGAAAERLVAALKATGPSGPADR